MYFQVKLLREEILPNIGLSVYRQTGLESDDLMAQAALQASEHYPTGGNRAAVIITSDGDLYQCITSSVHWYDPGRDLYLTPHSFFRKKGIASSEWGVVKAIAGCNSDEVKGIPGVGEKSAIQYLLGSLPSNHKRFQSIISSEGKAIIARNKQLVILPHTKTKPIELKEPQYNEEAFLHYCTRYGLLSYLKKEKRKAWHRLFNNNKYDRGLQRKRKHGNKEKI